MKHRYQPRRDICRHCGQRIHQAFGDWWDSAGRGSCLPGGIAAMRIDPRGPYPTPGPLGLIEHQPREAGQ